MRGMWALALVGLVACGTEDEAPLPGPLAGSERGPCYGNGTCNEGLLCLSQICVRPVVDGGSSDADLDAAVNDSGLDGAVDGGLDAEVPDQGPLDQGAGDAEPSDLGPGDGDLLDADPADLGPNDLGPLDANPQDTGPDVGGLDLGFPDGGGLDGGGLDGGPIDVGPLCDPVSGVPCVSPNICHWPAPLDLGLCEPVQQALGFEAPCDQADDQCGLGLTCLFLSGEPAPSCHRVCNLGSGQSCSNLSGNAFFYVCGSISGSQVFDACLPTGTLCDPLQPACPANQVCSFLAGQTSCEPAGTAQLGQACSLGQNCATGQGMCFDTGSGGFCRLVCDPAGAPSCGPQSSCVSITGQNYGACLPIACSPFSSPCPGGQVCSAASGNLECRNAGSGQPGDPCSVALECGTGVICVSLGPGGGQCFEPCDPNNPCSSPGATCLNITGLDFGVCF
ncbi:MAG: hypothetical protein IPG45_04045 [Deltaproteobacteria bacterium]|nr:hypothetical protein [Deltaproteobacteria bacterium]